MKSGSTRTFNLLTELCGILVVLMLIAAGVYWFIQRPVFLLRSVDVNIDGNKEAVTLPLLAQMLRGRIVGNYFTVDISELRDTLKTIPWVKEVSVTRVWPNKLDIDLRLHKPVAIWGGSEILAEDGTIFEGNQAVAESSGRLPQIEGPKTKRMDIYKQYLVFEGICKRYGFDVTSLSFSEFGGWVLRFGRPGQLVKKIVFKTDEKPDHMERILESVLKDIPKISNYFGAEPTDMDARYNKGVAVVRPQPQAPVEPETSESKDGR